MPIAFIQNEPSILILLQFLICPLNRWAKRLASQSIQSFPLFKSSNPPSFHFWEHLLLIPSILRDYVSHQSYFYISILDLSKVQLFPHNIAFDLIIGFPAQVPSLFLLQEPNWSFWVLFHIFNLQTLFHLKAQIFGCSTYSNIVFHLMIFLLSFSRDIGFFAP